MKRWIAWILTLALAASLSACSGEGDPIVETSGAATAATEEAVPVTVEPTTEGTEVTQPEETVNQTEADPEETKPEETKPEETKPEETKPEETTPEETKPEETKPQETTPEETKPQETEPNGSTSADGVHKHDINYRRVKTYTYCYEHGYEYFYCSCGWYMYSIHTPREHDYSSKTITKATHDKEGLKELTCHWCPYTTTAVIPKVDVPYFLRIELVSCDRPNSVYLSDGTQLLDRIYGPYEVCQIGDSYTYRIVMSDGGTTGFTVRNEHPHTADMTVDGNLVTITPKSFEGNAFLWFSVKSNDIDNEPVRDGRSMKVLLGNYKLTDCGNNSIYVTLRDYITRNGMESYLTLLNAFNFGELTSYTDGDPSLSISGTGKYGYDDYIVISAHPDWLELYFATIDAYKARGFTKVYMYFTGSVIEMKAC